MASSITSRVSDSTTMAASTSTAVTINLMAVSEKLKKSQLKRSKKYPIQLSMYRRLKRSRYLAIC
jgi:hypothetical protein